MKTEKFNWETTFENETMTHSFSERVTVVTDFKFGIVSTFRDGEPIDKFSIVDNELSLDDYERFLIGIAKLAEQLKSL
jgi:hypothetical protein